MEFRDRADAGRRLTEQLIGRDLHEVVLLAVPRGGVPVGFEVAQALGVPLEVFVARKIGAPGRPELGIGAIAEGDGIVVDTARVRALGVSDGELEGLVAAEGDELDRRVRHYRGDRSLPALDGRDVVLVDDGIATGVTAEAALRGLRMRAPRTLLMAVPVCARETAQRLRAMADEVVCVLSPADFRAVGLWYVDFGQTSDDEVLDLLARAGADELATR